MKHKLYKLVTVLSAAVIGAASVAMFAGCTTKHPTVTITYAFNGKDYKVDYTLSRNDAPQTVQHFLELAKAGYYDGMCIHDYESNGTYLKTGGYKLDEHGELQEVNYWETIAALEAKGEKFTQSVWNLDGSPLYTVYGEFENNGVKNQYGAEYYHSEGALVMYYTEKGDSVDYDVKVKRADNGKEQTVKYKTNSITSLFYTYTGTSNFEKDKQYSVFGKATKYEEQMTNGLLKAISDYKEEHENEDFAQEKTWTINFYEPNLAVSREGLEDTYDTPVTAPIIIKGIKINKY